MLLLVIYAILTGVSSVYLFFFCYLLPQGEQSIFRYLIIILWESFTNCLSTTLPVLV